MIFIDWSFSYFLNSLLSLKYCLNGMWLYNIMASHILKYSKYNFLENWEFITLNIWHESIMLMETFIRFISVFEHVYKHEQFLAVFINPRKWTNSVNFSFIYSGKQNVLTFFFLCCNRSLTILLHVCMHVFNIYYVLLNAKVITYIVHTFENAEKRGSLGGSAG